MTKAKAKKTAVAVAAAPVAETFAIPPIPYRLGDVVKIVRHDEEYLERVKRKSKQDIGESEPSGAWAIGAEHVIDEAHLDGDSFRYSTNHGAWFEHTQFALVRPCDDESLDVLRKAHAEEEDDESDEEDDGEEEEDDTELAQEHSQRLDAEERDANDTNETEPSLASEDGQSQFIAGRDAALRGCQLTDNPHNAGSVKSLDWSRGFDFEVNVQFEKNGSIHMFGRRAFRDGVKKKSNPHEKGTVDHKSWKKGYKAARRLAPGYTK